MRILCIFLLCKFYSHSFRRIRGAMHIQRTLIEVRVLSDVDIHLRLSSILMMHYKFNSYRCIANWQLLTVWVMQTLQKQKEFQKSPFKQHSDSPQDKCNWIFCCFRIWRISYPFCYAPIFKVLNIRHLYNVCIVLRSVNNISLFHVGKTLKSAPSQRHIKRVNLDQFLCSPYFPIIAQCPPLQNVHCGI